MATKSEYGQREIEAAKSVLIELMQILGEYREQMVLIGGWVPFIVMKGMALYGRMKEKDAWDIYFCVRNHEGGIEGLAKEFEPVLENKLVQEGLGKIRAKFNSVDAIGPTSIADFDEIIDRDERERIKRDAFERVTALLDILKVTAFEE